MSENKPPRKKNFFTGRYDREFVEVVCPTCQRSKIICLPEESMPTCEFCHKLMILKEILTEGKY